MISIDNRIIYIVWAENDEYCHIDGQSVSESDSQSIEWGGQFRCFSLC